MPSGAPYLFIRHLDQIIKIETKIIKGRHPDGTIEECSFQIALPPCRLVFAGVGLHEREFSERDLFDALTSPRKALEEMGVQLLCAGAARMFGLLEWVAPGWWPQSLHYRVGLSAADPGKHKAAVITAIL
jgi:hypothetical protein